MRDGLAWLSRDRTHRVLRCWSIRRPACCSGPIASCAPVAAPELAWRGARHSRPVIGHQSSIETAVRDSDMFNGRVQPPLDTTERSPQQWIASTPAGSCLCVRQRSRRNWWTVRDQHGNTPSQGDPCHLMKSSVPRASTLPALSPGWISLSMGARSSPSFQAMDRPGSIDFASRTDSFSTSEPSPVTGPVLPLCRMGAVCSGRASLS